jgi:MOSC domain-containing protein YiiM
MLTIGPYSFTDTDAQRTVRHAFDVWELFEEGRDASVLDPLRPTLTGDVAVDLERVWTAWMAAGPALRAAGQLPARQEGRVEHLHLGSGGLPKLPADRVTVSWRGVDGDRQATRVHHGRPWQALCLWSCELIESFQAEGHPIAPGLAGENITLRGFDWAQLRPGVRLQVGEVLCELSSYATPCSQNAGWFKDGAFDVMHERHGPVARVYATVLEPGAIAVGDLAVLEP